MESVLYINTISKNGKCTLHLWFLNESWDQSGLGHQETILAGPGDRLSSARRCRSLALFTAAASPLYGWALGITV